LQEEVLLYLAISTGAVLAQEAESESDGGFGSFFLLILIVVGAYLLIASPQRRRMKAARQKQKDLRETLEYGDEVVTIGGIHGRVTATSEEDVTIDVGGGMELRMARRAIAERLEDDTE
jgi:preprotein translocase subunit YajC